MDKKLHAALVEAVSMKDYEQIIKKMALLVKETGNASLLDKVKEDVENYMLRLK